MGYNTTVLILNDGIDQIEKHPEQFVERIVHTLNDGGSVGVGNHANCVQVMKSQHADVFRVYGSHGNLMIELSQHSAETMDLVRRYPHLVREYIDRAKGHLLALEEILKEQRK